jgi:hypothetical protein
MFFERENRSTTSFTNVQPQNQNSKISYSSNTLAVEPKYLIFDRFSSKKTRIYPIYNMYQVIQVFRIIWQRSDILEHSANLVHFFVLLFRIPLFLSDILRVIISFLFLLFVIWIHSPFCYRRRTCLRISLWGVLCLCASFVFFIRVESCYNKRLRKNEEMGFT